MTDSVLVCRFDSLRELSLSSRPLFASPFTLRGGVVVYSGVVQVAAWQQALTRGGPWRWRGELSPPSAASHPLPPPPPSRRRRSVSVFPAAEERAAPRRLPPASPAALAAPYRVAPN